MSEKGTKQLSDVNAGNISKCIITSNTGKKAVDVSAGVVDFRYYESVLSNYITAQAIIVDTGYETDGKTGKGVLDDLPIRGGERFDITFTDAGNPQNKVELTLYVNRVLAADPGTLKENFVLSLASAEYIGNELTRVVKRYQGKISDNVKSILGDVLKSETEVTVDDTAIDYNFYGNDRKPFYVCTWLASKSTSQSAGTGGSGSIGGSAGYLFYQNQKGFNFRSLDKLLEQSPDKKFIFTNTTSTNDAAYKSILSVNIDRNVDLQSNLALGVYHNRTVFYDPVSFNYVTISFDIEDQGDKITTAGETPASTLVKPEFVQGPSRLMTNVLDIGYNPTGVTPEEQLQNWKEDITKPNFDAPRTQVQSIMRYNQVFTIQTNITVAGDFSIMAGDMIECKFIQLEGGGDGEINKETEGSYLVAHLCHRLTPSDTFTSLGLVRDSYGRPS